MVIKEVNFSEHFGSLVLAVGYNVLQNWSVQFVQTTDSRVCLLCVCGRICEKKSHVWVQCPGYIHDTPNNEAIIGYHDRWIIHTGPGLFLRQGQKKSNFGGC